MYIAKINGCWLSTLPGGTQALGLDKRIATKFVNATAAYNAASRFADENMKQEMSSFELKKISEETE
ncbi:MAG: hypothetical protein HUJ68_13080 [Clostridia bacterium]|nr:hypothetical protein [Clostridia bacterium]